MKFSFKINNNVWWNVKPSYVFLYSMFTVILINIEVTILDDKMTI